MKVRVLRGTSVGPWLDGLDRGLAYGDGVFETLLVHQGQPVWWREHWDRLLRGAAVLGLAAPDEIYLRREADLLMAEVPRAVLKIILTRGIGGRGYAPPDEAVPTVVLSLHPAPEPVPEQGLVVRWCRTPVAIQPALAGIKHLNRLEQVLARSEWRDPDIHEGLMCDTEGLVVSATAGNVFARIAGRWLTPRVSRCGIAGIARGWLLSQVADSAEADLTPAEIAHADALLVCNSVRGLMPVRRLGLSEWSSSEDCAALRRRLHEALPAFV